MSSWSISRRIPDYPADVLYALLSVRLVDTGVAVDGALLIISGQGD
jgi:hypothetical protein